MPDLDRDAILGADDLRREPVAVPEWGGTVYVQTMTAAQLGKWQALIRSKKDDASNVEDHIDAMTTLLCFTLTDANGVRLFENGDAERLGERNPTVLRRLMDKALEVNALDKQASEEVEKNSDAIPADGSP